MTFKNHLVQIPTAEPTMPGKTVPSDSATDSPIQDRLDHILQLLENELGGKSIEGESTRIVLDNTRLALTQALEEIKGRDLTIADMQEQSQRLASAQADAIVHSAEIIDELERTKQSLADARQAAEEAAEDTQRLADTIFERTNDGVFVFEGQTCIACNDNGLSLLRANREQVVGAWPTAFQEALLEDHSSAEGNLVQAIVDAENQLPQTLEVQLTTRGATAFWAEVTFSSFNMKSRSHVLVVVRDVTARKQFEVELKRHRDFLHNIINAVPDPLSVKTCDQKLVVANDAFCEAYGLDRERIIGQNALKHLSTSEAVAEESADWTLLAERAGQTNEQHYCDSEGNRKIASVKRSVFDDQTTGERYIVATSRDITEERQRETQLQMLASVFESATEGAAILQANGRIVEANPAFLKMANVQQASQVAGTRVWDAFAGSQSELEFAIAQAATGKHWAGKISLSRNQGRKESYWISFSPTNSNHTGSGRIIALISDITELENSQNELRHRALHDPLTDLPNRAYFRELLDQYTQSRDNLTVCFLDLDDFKHVNDSSGHAAGDTLLRQVSDRITEVVGPGAVLARFGGDEFALIIHDRDYDASIRLVDELLHRFREPFQVNETSAVVGLSVGVTQYPTHACDTDSLLQSADIAMYAAKTAGKNRVRVFEASLQDTVNLRHRVQTKLQDALQDGEISLHFQPKFDSRTRRMVSCESLVRWKNQNGQYVPPSEFIPIAEQTGLIAPLGDLVFQLAAEQACQWKDRELPQRIAVNVSPHQLRHPGFVKQTLDTLQATGAKAEWFELEITEHAMMEDIDHAVGVINQLSDLGFRIAVDDFGTGYSSLSYLKHFRIHTLKIDISFVRDVTTDPYSEAIVKSIVSLGSGLGLTVVAEGVETKEQADLLTDFGCHVLQGYYLGHPQPPEELESQIPYQS